MGEKTPNFPLYPVLILFGILGLLLVGLLSGQPKIPPATRVAPTEVAQAEATEAAVDNTTRDTAQTVTYSAEDVTQGQALFQSTCSACHGTDATGIAGLGKNLVTSTFVHGLTDEELHQFIITGRPITDPLNTTGIMMPPKGGNPAFDDAQINLIIAFIRSRQAENAGEIAAAAAAPTPSEPIVYEPYTLPIEGMDFTNVLLPQRQFNVAEAYALSCSGCHGAQGEGGSASALTASALTQSRMSDDDIFALLTTLHPPVDPTTGFSHPVRGEYPALSDAQLHDLIDYLHTLPAAS